MSFVRATTVGSALALCACASVPMARPERDLDAKRFEVPPDQALLYVYRDETFGSAIKLTVLVDGQHVGDTAAHTFLLVPIAAGRHQIVSKSENDSSVELTAREGKAYFVWQEVKMGLFAARSELHLVNGKAGRAAVATCSLAESPVGLKYPLAGLGPAPAAQPTVEAASAPSPAPAAQPTVETASAATSGGVSAAAAEGFPRVLSGDEIVSHFARHPSLDASLGRQSFKLIVQPDNSVERVCPGCRVTRGTGEIKLEADRVCIRWTRVTFPDSGCYQLVQTAADRYTLRGLDRERSISYSAAE